MAFKMRRRWVSKPHWMGGFHLTMIGKEMDRWIFSSSSLILKTKEIVNWWRLGKKGIPFIFIGQGKEVLGKGFWRRFILLHHILIWTWTWFLLWLLVGKGTYDLEWSFGKEVLNWGGENVTHRKSFLFSIVVSGYFVLNSRSIDHINGFV